MEILQTERLLIRKFKVLDLDDLYELFGPQKADRHSTPLSEDYDKEQELLSSYIYYMYGFYGFGLFAVCLKDSGILIGRCGFWVSELSGEYILELGYDIGVIYQGLGYGYEAVSNLLTYAEEELGYDKIMATIHIDNLKSCIFIEAFGFEKVDKIVKNEQEYFLYLKELS